MPLTRAIIRTYTAATQLADVELLEGPRALQVDVPFAASVEIRHRAAGTHVLLENYAELGPVIVAPWRVTRQGNLQGQAYDGGSQTFTGANWNDYPNLELSVTLVESSYIWHLCQVNQHHDNSATALSAYWRVYCSDTGEGHAISVSCPATEYWMPVFLTDRTGPHAAGTITIDLQCKLYNSGQTIDAVGATNGYIVIPAE